MFKIEKTLHKTGWNFILVVWFVKKSEKIIEWKKHLKYDNGKENKVDMMNYYYFFFGDVYCCNIGLHECFL